MEYTIQQLARLAGISTRTLRYYDQIGLLPPTRSSQSGYRIYGPQAVDTLQQILFYKELGFALSQIQQALSAPDFDRLHTLNCHLAQLEQRRAHLEALIQTVTQTIEAEQGGFPMSDTEKFTAFKEKLIQKNEETYGAEIRQAYGDDVVDRSNAKMMGLTPEQYRAMEETGEELLNLLEQAVQEGETPQGPLGRRAAALHKAWLSFTCPSYTAQTHLGLVEMYLADERFQSYYDRHLPGCTAFLAAAVQAWLAQ